ncbi:MAG: hypothetical protein QNJ58_02910 [Desulfobacterales bacterium]|nr:hypothetical protein [Desulfobacterales bacterium]
MVRNHSISPIQVLNFNWQIDQIGVAGWRMLGTGCWILDAECWILDAGCWVLDTGCRILDTGC